MQNHYFVLLHHYYTIITSLLHHYYFIITKGKSCNNDYIITCYAKGKPLLLHYYYVLLRHYFTVEPRQQGRDDVPASSSAAKATKSSSSSACTLRGGFLRFQHTGSRTIAALVATVYSSAESCTAAAAAMPPLRRTEARQLQRWQSPGNLWCCTPFHHCRCTPSTMDPPGRWRKRHRNRYPGGYRVQLRLRRRLRYRRRFCSATRPLQRWPELASAGALAAAGVEAAAGEEEGVTLWLQAVPSASPLPSASLACASICGFEFAPTFARLKQVKGPLCRSSWSQHFSGDLQISILCFLFPRLLPLIH